MKGFKDSKGKFRPTGNKSKSPLRKSDLSNVSKGSGVKHDMRYKKSNGIEPLEPFSKRERIRLLSEEQISRDYTYDELEDVRNDIDATLSSLYFADHPNKKNFSMEVAFKTKDGSPEFEMLLHERGKVQGAMNTRTLRSLGGANTFESTGFPEIDEMRSKDSLGDSRLVDSIQHGSKVTIVTSNGQKITGRAVMKSSMGDNSWVLNTGGQYGKTALASDDNVISVK